MSPTHNAQDLVHADLGIEVIKAGGVGSLVGVGSGIVHSLWININFKRMVRYSLTRGAQFGFYF